MVVIFTFLTIFYVLLVFFCARWAMAGLFSRQEEELKAQRHMARKKEEEKEFLHKEKMKLQAEAASIFTLYEITKDITKTLNEADAFKTFKMKLSEHVRFLDCRFLPPDDGSVPRLQKDPDHFVFTLRAKDKKAGYLAVKGVSDEEKETIVILATQFSLALRRVELYQEIERIAITDSLTEIHTRRYTLERFDEEIGRSKAHGRKLAFLMIDVDHFKEFNDTYGHLTGDMVLREIGRIIKGSLREIDIAGRYGGEEFCIVLPDTDLDGARFAAERIRQATETTPIKAYDATVQATVSIGISQFPKDGVKAADLIEHADQALYRAKKEGRNRVSSSSRG